MEVSQLHQLDWIESYSIFCRRCCPKELRLECKICHTTLVCIALYHALIIYVHSIFPKMFRICIHLGVHKHPMSNYICCESLDMAFQCVANVVMKTPIAKSATIIMAANK